MNVYRLEVQNEFGEKVYAIYSIIIINKNSAYFITFSEAFYVDRS